MNVTSSKIYFAKGEYARHMRVGMADIVDMAGLRNNNKQFVGALVNRYYEPFDALMGFSTYNPTSKVFEKRTGFDILPDMNKRTFAIQSDLLAYAPFVSSTVCNPNYFKCEITYDTGVTSAFYGFITSQTTFNASNATQYTFDIDWAHTFQYYWYKTHSWSKAISDDGSWNMDYPFDFKQAYVSRHNKHTIKSPTNTTKIIDCGRGRENVVPYELPTLAEETPYEYALANLSTFSDRDIRYIRFTFSQTKIADELFANGIYGQKDELGTGMVYAFLPLIPRGTYSYVRQVLGSATIGANYEDYLGYTNGLTRALTLASTCVSVELIPSAPFVKKVDSLRTTTGNLGIEITYDDAAVVGITPSVSALKDKIWLLQTGTDNTHILPKAVKYKIGVSTGSLNSPALTCGYTNETFNAYYKHTKTRESTPLDPKLGQAQYAATKIVDNMGGELMIDALEINGDLETIEVIADYTGSVFKRKWYLSDGERAYANDVYGRRYCGVNDKMNGYPLINDAYIDYMNGRKNQVINGLAVAQAKGYADIASGLIESAAGATVSAVSGSYFASPAQAARGAVGAYGSMASSGAHTAISGAQSLLISQWNYNAQTADLKEQADTVERAKGNNAEFDVIENNGAIVRQIWRTSEKDTRRLVEYFHNNGYAVGEQQRYVFNNSMYYFDFCQCSDIIFNYSDDEYTLPQECYESLRAMFARGVRIWHGNSPDASGENPQIFRTQYLNTAIGY